MARTTSLLLLIVLAHHSPALGKEFLGRRKSEPIHPEMWAGPNYNIQAVLNEVLDPTHSVNDAHVMAIEARISPLFATFPKNARGRISIPYVRYGVQRHFSQEYGWMITGFEPHGNKSKTLEGNATFTREFMRAEQTAHRKAPAYVEQVLQKMHKEDGFSLQDLTFAVIAIERLIFDEVIQDTMNVYHLYMMSPTEELHDKSQVTDLLASYYVIEHLEGNSTDSDVHQHQMSHMRQSYPLWTQAMEVIEDIVSEDIYQRQGSTNPFAKQTFAFEDVARMAGILNERSAEFSNRECHDMKTVLSSFDVHETGRVRPADFYGAAKKGAWNFYESMSYLKGLGAVDTSSLLSGPQLIIPNYVNGINNCLTSSAFYKVCCLNECEGIYQHLEAQIKKPTASAQEIMQAIEQGIAPNSLFSSTIDTEARNLSTSLRTRLEDIAEHHENKIPLHGRLLAQWLHFAFPRECPFPHKSGTVVDPRAPRELRGVENAGETVSTEELDHHIESEEAQRPACPEAGSSMWSMDEELIDPMMFNESAGNLRGFGQIFLCLCMACFVLNEASKARGQYSFKQKKDAGLKQYDV